MQILEKHRARSATNSCGFTLIELLVVIGIIAILAGILVPVIGKVRLAAYDADSKNQLNEIAGSIERYVLDFRTYPGPLRNDECASAFGGGGFTPGTTAPFTSFASTASSGNFDTTDSRTTITMSENLVLGLLGGLKTNAAGTGLIYDPAIVGQGPSSLNTLNPRKYNPYTTSQGLSWRTEGTNQTGHFKDAAGQANDSIIPEFIDRFPSGMPILYFRSKPGVPLIAAGITSANNSVITDGNAPRSAPYDLSQNIGYTGSYTGAWPGMSLDSAALPTGRSIGADRSPPKQYFNGSATPVDYSTTGSYHGLRKVTPTAVMGPKGTNYFYPYDAFPYFTNPSMANTPRGKDSYILVAPGKDRIYGTNDDNCSFGAVVP